MELWARADFEAMNRFMAFNRPKPVVDKVFTFTDTAAPNSHVESRSH